MKIWLALALYLAGSVLIVAGRSVEMMTVGGMFLAAAVCITLLASARSQDTSDVDRDQLIRG